MANPVVYFPGSLGQVPMKIYSNGDGTYSLGIQTVGPATTTTVTISGSASLSGAAVLTTGRVVGFATDASWTPQAVTFQISPYGNTFYNLYNEGTEYSIASMPASAYTSVNPAVFLGANQVKVRSGTSGSAIAQGSATTLTLFVATI